MSDKATSITFESPGDGPEYSGVSIWLPQLYLETARDGVGTIEGRTFVECRFQGPAVLLPIEGCHFDDCFLGAHDGDPKVLMLTPLSGQGVVGVVPFRNCRFERCTFEGVGFTGHATFLGQLLSMFGDTV